MPPDESSQIESEKFFQFHNGSVVKSPRSFISVANWRPSKCTEADNSTPSTAFVTRSNVSENRSTPFFVADAPLSVYPRTCEFLYPKCQWIFPAFQLRCHPPWLQLLCGLCLELAARCSISLLRTALNFSCSFAHADCDVLTFSASTPTCFSTSFNCFFCASIAFSTSSALRSTFTAIRPIRPATPFQPRADNHRERTGQRLKTDF